MINPFTTPNTILEIGLTISLTVSRLHWLVLGIPNPKLLIPSTSVAGRMRFTISIKNDLEVRGFSLDDQTVLW